MGVVVCRVHFGIVFIVRSFCKTMPCFLMRSLCLLDHGSRVSPGHVKIMHPFTVPSWTHGSDGVHVILNGLRGVLPLPKCVRLAAGSGFVLGFAALNDGYLPRTMSLCFFSLVGESYVVRPVSVSQSLSTHDV